MEKTQLAKKLMGFTQHRAVIVKESPDGSQAILTCPFCKNDKLFVNINNLLWDCKTCNISGNFEGFLEHVAHHCREAATPQKLEELSKNRGIPAAILREYEIGWNGVEYTLPLRGSMRGKVTEVRRYPAGKKLVGTLGGHLALFCAPVDRNVGANADTFYLCEGEWDAMAMATAMRESKLPGKVYGSPGAGAFPKQMAAFFSGKKVILLFDNDKGGQAGLVRTWKLLSAAGAHLSRLVWPQDGSFADGYDVRDLWNDKGHNGRDVINFILGHLTNEAPEEIKEKASAEAKREDDKDRLDGEYIPAEKVEDAYRNWLNLTTTEPLDVLYGSAFANRIAADPLWMFFVAPSGGGKSELLMSLHEAPMIYTTTSLTPQALISGAQFGERDPSLIPKILGKILVVKDFTAVLQMQITAREEIFSILRDAYDGVVEKHFGNGIIRRYEGHFGFFAGVTPAIEAHMSTGSILGERFIKYYIRRETHLHAAGKEIDLALENLTRESDMRGDLRKMARDVLRRPINREEYPKRPKWFDEGMKNLAQWVSMLRGAVARERYTQQVLHKPTPEVGTRLAKQLALLGMGIGLYRGERELSRRTFQTVSHVARDTAPDRVEEVVMQLFINADADYISTTEVSEHTRFPLDTARAILQDLEMLKIARRKPGSQGWWNLTENMRQKTKQLGIYGTDVAWRRMKNGK